MGQAAGTAAALANSQGLGVNQISVDMLQATLKAEKADLR